MVICNWIHICHCLVCRSKTSSPQLEIPTWSSRWPLGSACITLACMRETERLWRSCLSTVRSRYAFTLYTTLVLTTRLLPLDKWHKCCVIWLMMFYYRNEWCWLLVINIPMFTYIEHLQFYFTNFMSYISLIGCYIYPLTARPCKARGTAVIGQEAGYTLDWLPVYRRDWMLHYSHKF